MVGEQRIARLVQLAAVVQKERRVETVALRRQPERTLRRGERAQRFANEHGARLRGVGGQLLVRPDRERRRGNDEERK